MMANFVLAFLLSAGVVSADLFVSHPDHQKFLFEEFKTDFNKKYSAEEEDNRFQIFVSNLKLADERNAEEKMNGGTAVHGITQFMDLSPAEFRNRFLLSDPRMKTNGAEVVEISEPVNTTAGVTDWSGKYTTPVKNQAQCGSCWAFSATEQIESDSMRTLGTNYILSPEQIVQCDKTSYGCNGGWTEHAYNYVKSTGGITTDSNYPYTSSTGVTGQCADKGNNYVISVSGYSTVKGESSMASYVQKTGPLSVCLDASTWSTYKGGIMTSCPKQVDHCVQAVGVDASSNGYWKVRNSWGTSWGESGYIRLAYGKNTCDITNDPTWVTVKKA